MAGTVVKFENSNTGPDYLLKLAIHVKVIKLNCFIFFSVFGSAKCVFSSFITLNYYVGDFVATIISYVYNFLAR